MSEGNTIGATYETEMKCPVCEKTFTITKTRSKFLRLEKKDPDNCPYYTGINPIFYTAYVCPECGYAALERHFSDVTVNGKAEVLNKITPKWNKREFSGMRDLNAAIEVHKLVLLNYSIMHYPFHEIAKLCLKIAWLYRYVGNSKEMEYVKHAYDMFVKSFTNEPIDEDPNNEANILYLMGELARQLEMYKKSVEWFGMALQTEGIKVNKPLEKLTRDQWAEAKEAFSKMKKEQQ